MHRWGSGAAVCGRSMRVHPRRVPAAVLPLLRSIFSEWPWVAPLLVVASLSMSLTTVAAVLLDRRCRSQSAISWVLLVIAAPFVGPIIYWIFGKPWLSARREASYRAVAEERAGVAVAHGDVDCAGDAGDVCCRGVRGGGVRRDPVASNAAAKVNSAVSS